MNYLRNHEMFQDVKIFQGTKLVDERGIFRKPFFGDDLVEILGEIKEVIVTTTKKNFFRGLHFQLPPRDMNKLVTCIDGSVVDFFVDLRRSSATYGQIGKLNLNSESLESILIPKGFAHGLVSTEESSTIVYLQSENFDNNLDSGINITSFGDAIDIEKINFSEKDRNLQSLLDFKSPWT